MLKVSESNLTRIPALTNLFNPRRQHWNDAGKNAGATIPTFDFFAASA
jgi:hypothetical protein